MWDWFRGLFSDFSEKAKVFLSESGLKIILAVLAAAVGILAIRIILRLIKKRIAASSKNTVLSSFVLSCLRVVLYVVVFLIVLTILGVPITSFLVIAGSVSIAVGLSFQSTLSNFFSGMTLIASRPFKIGDHVNIDGNEGVIKSIGIMNTSLVTYDNKLIVLPNNSITTNSITNFSFHKTRRVDFAFRSSFDMPIDSIKQKVIEAARNHPLVLDEKFAADYNASLLHEKNQKEQHVSLPSDNPKSKNRKTKKKDIATYFDDKIELVVADNPTVRVMGIGESAVNLSLRVWTKTENYWTVFFDLNEKIIEALSKNGYLSAYNKLDINIKNH